MTAYDSVWELITATQAEQLTRTSQCLLPLTVSHFDLRGPRHAVAKAQNNNFGDSSRAVWPATRAKRWRFFVKWAPSGDFFLHFSLLLFFIIISTIITALGQSTSTTRPPRRPLTLRINRSVPKLWGEILKATVGCVFKFNLLAVASKLTCFESNSIIALFTLSNLSPSQFILGFC